MDYLYLIKINTRKYNNNISKEIISLNESLHFISGTVVFIFNLMINEEVLSNLNDLYFRSL